MGPRFGVGQEDICHLSISRRTGWEEYRGGVIRQCLSVCHVENR